MDTIFLRNSENLKQLIELMKLHEQNINTNLELKRLTYKDKESNTDTSIDTDTDVSMNINTPVNTSTYMECEYGTIPSSIKCYDHFKTNDPMIVVKSCGHAFRKEPFMEWIKMHHTCMQCASLL